MWKGNDAKIQITNFRWSINLFFFFFSFIIRKLSFIIVIIVDYSSSIAVNQNHFEINSRYFIVCLHCRISFVEYFWKPSHWLVNFKRIYGFSNYSFRVIWISNDAHKHNTHTLRIHNIGWLNIIIIWIEFFLMKCHTVEENNMQLSCTI